MSHLQNLLYTFFIVCIDFHLVKSKWVAQKNKNRKQHVQRKYLTCNVTFEDYFDISNKSSKIL